MATKQSTVEVRVCDFCQNDGCYEKCHGCGKDVCHRCEETAGIKYKHSVYCSGSGDGFYCSECNSKLTASQDPRLMAYKRIRSLRSELEGFHADFNKRREEAEKQLEKLSN